MDVENYDVGERVGLGGFGVVNKAIDKRDGRTVALKKLERSKNPERIEEEIRALKNLRKCPHNNIVKYIESFTKGNYKYIVLEYCEYGDLRKYLRGCRLSDRQAAYVLSQLVDAVSHMHRQRIMHRDLSTANILISGISVDHRTKEDILNVKVTDFGSAAVSQHSTIEDRASIVGTPGYIAPQVFKKKYNIEADVYSLGAVLFVMTSGRAPPDNCTSSRRKTSPDLCGVSEAAIQLIRRMMCKDHKNRIHLLAPTDADSVQERGAVDGATVSRAPGAVEGAQRRLWSTTTGRAAQCGKYVQLGPTQSYRPDRTLLLRPRISSERPVALSRLFVMILGRIDGDVTAIFRNTGSYGGRCARRERRSRDRRAHKTPFTAAEPTPSPVWPLVTDRIGAQVETHGVGRFRLNEDRSVVAEFVDSGGVVSRIMTIYSTVLNDQVNQTVTIYEPYLAIKLEDQSAEVVAVDVETAKSFESPDEMPDRVLKQYRNVALFINRLAGKVIKIKYYHPRFPHASCRLMENGDFHLCLKDGSPSEHVGHEQMSVAGRVAVQRVDSREVKVYVIQGDASCRLTKTERRIFDQVRTEIIVFMHTIERHPGVFPILAGTPSSRRSPQVDSQALNRMSSMPSSRPSPALSSAVLRNSERANKENRAPRCSDSNGIVSEMRDGAIAWVKCIGTGNRLRISQADVNIVVYRLANGTEQRLETLSKTKPVCAEEMFQYLLSIAHHPTYDSPFVSPPCSTQLDKLTNRKPYRMRDGTAEDVAEQADEDRAELNDGRW